MSENEIILTPETVTTMPDVVTQTQDRFKPRILIKPIKDGEFANSEFAEIFKKAQSVSAGIPVVGTRAFTGLVDGKLEFPDAEFVVVEDYNEGRDVTHNGVTYPYVGFSPTLHCNVYRNPNSPAFVNAAAAIEEIKNDPAIVTPVPVVGLGETQLTATQEEFKKKLAEEQEAKRLEAEKAASETSEDEDEKVPTP